MRVPLDTHSFLWFVEGAASLSATAREAIESPSNEPLLSMASLREMAIKISIGKLTLAPAGPLEDVVGELLRENGIDVLPIDIAHVGEIVAMPFHHKDPFDRLIAAQALVERMPVIGRDESFDRYGVRRIW